MEGGEKSSPGLDSREKGSGKQILNCSGISMRESSRSLEGGGKKGRESVISFCGGEDLGKKQRRRGKEKGEQTLTEQTR